MRPQLGGRKRSANEPAQAAGSKKRAAAPAKKGAKPAASMISPGHVQDVAHTDCPLATPGAAGSAAALRASNVARVHSLPQPTLPKTIHSGQPQPSKAAAAGNAEGVLAAKAPRKRTKAADMDLAAVEAKAHGPGGLAKLSVPELQCLLKARKLPVGGKKADLVARVELHLAAAEPAV